MGKTFNLSVSGTSYCFEDVILERLFASPAEGRYSLK